MSDTHPIQSPPSPTVDVQAVREKLYAFIFPNEPVTDEEKAAFERAFSAQLRHEQEMADMVGLSALPDGVSSFAIGNFSMEFGEGMKGGLSTSRGICRSAYAILLREGLLYRGLS